MTSEFGNVSDDYAKYRDALPQVLFNQLIDQGVCFAGNQIIELGAGTGIISRDLAMLGAHVIGIEPSPQMIEQAERSVLGTSAGSVRYICAAAESFEVDHRVPIMIAARAWHWFDRTKTLQNIDKHLTEEGILIIINSIFRSDSDIAQLTFGVLQLVTADLMGRLKGHAALLHIPYQATVVVLRKR